MKKLYATVKNLHVLPKSIFCAFQYSNLHQKVWRIKNQFLKVGTSTLTTVSV